MWILSPNTFLSTDSGTTSFFVSAFLFVFAFAFCVGVGLGLGLGFAGLFAFFTRRVVHASCTQRCPGGADGSDSF
jgi:hypothetical protein